MKRHCFLLALMAVTMMFWACKDKDETKPTSEVADYVMPETTLEKGEVNQMLDIVNSMAECLDSIQIEEDMILKMKEGTPKEQIAARLNAFKDLLKRKQAEIDKLSGQNKTNNKANKVPLANFQKIIDFLNLQLQEKGAEVTKLEKAVQTKDSKISELRYDTKQLSKESDYLKDQNFEQDQLLNQAFYIVAEKNELQELGLLSGGAFSKKRANYANIDQSKFKKVDVRGFNELLIDSKSPKILTEKPAASYTLTKNDDGTSTLTITDPKSFWTASPYLIIQK